MAKRIPPFKYLRLTPGQAEFLRVVMQDYMDVTTDRGVRQRARQIKAKVDRIYPRSHVGARSK